MHKYDIINKIFKKVKGRDWYAIGPSPAFVVFPPNGITNQDAKFNPAF